MKTVSYADIFKNEKNFRYMFFANIISRFGDSVDAVAYRLDGLSADGFPGMAVCHHGREYGSDGFVSAVGRRADGIFS